MNFSIGQQQIRFPIGLVVSQFNQPIVKALKEAALQRLAAYGFLTEDIDVFDVPGAVEIPLTVQCLAKRQHYGAVIALGVVIRGETGHYDWVCHMVSEGCLKVSLGCSLPVIFGVLTTDNEEQAWDRINKGQEVVDCAVSMYQTLQQIEAM